jgi:hypothetical protein
VDARFRDTAGLIVDVRRQQRRGPRRAAAVVFVLLRAGDPPRVFNAAAYRLHSAHPENHLAENHRMYRAGAKEWTPEQRAAVNEFAKTFKPQWQLPAGQFSDWHYIALTRLDDLSLSLRQTISLLLNAKIVQRHRHLLAGLKGMKTVTLSALPAARQAFTQEIPLGATPLELRIGSMASFQADGKLYRRKRQSNPTCSWKRSPST